MSGESRSCTKEVSISGENIETEISEILEESVKTEVQPRAELGSLIDKVLEKEPPDSLPIPTICHTLEGAQQLQPDQLVLEIADLAQAQHSTALSSHQHLRVDST